MVKEGSVYKSLGLDNKDRRIMYALDVNSRAPISAIAKKLALDKNLVNYRINRLIEKNILLGFYAIVDVTRLGFEQFRVYFKYQNIDLQKEKELINFMVKSPTWWVGSIDGKWDLGVVLWTKGIYEFKDFWDKLMKRYRNFFHSYEVTIYAGLYHFSHAYLNPEKVEEKAMQFIGSREKAGISENEEKILEVLAENARLPTVEIAKKVGVTPIMVKYAIKKLAKNRIIKGFRAFYNSNLLNLTHYKVNFNLVDLKRYNELLDFAKENSNIIYVDQTVGNGDFEIELLVESHEKFKEIMQEIKGRFSGIIRDYDYFIYSKVHKIRYF